MKTRPWSPAIHSSAARASSAAAASCPASFARATAICGSSSSAITPHRSRLIFSSARSNVTSAGKSPADTCLRSWIPAGSRRCTAAPARRPGRCRPVRPPRRRREHSGRRHDELMTGAGSASRGGSRPGGAAGRDAHGLLVAGPGRRGIGKREELSATAESGLPAMFTFAEAVADKIPDDGLVGAVVSASCLSRRVSAA